MIRIWHAKFPKKYLKKFEEVPQLMARVPIKEWDEFYRHIPWLDSPSFGDSVEFYTNHDIIIIAGFKRSRNEKTRVGALLKLFTRKAKRNVRGQEGAVRHR